MKRLKNMRARHKPWRTPDSILFEEDSLWSLKPYENDNGSG